MDLPAHYSVHMFGSFVKVDPFNDELSSVVINGGVSDTHD